jgi:transketolase
MALAARMDGRDFRAYTIMGDGELAEGSVWEGAMSGSNYHLGNLCALVDRNRLQISGCTEDVMAQDSQEQRWAAFGWNVLSIDGHDLTAIDAALTLAEQTREQPTAIILNTVKGFGSPLMENKAGWHHHLPTAEEYAQISADFAAHRNEVQHV